MSQITLKRRTHFKLKPSKPLKGFILDLSINVPEDDIAFVHDQYAQTNPQPWNTATVMDAIKAEYERQYFAHYGKLPPKP